MKNVMLIEHPLISHKISLLRSKDTPRPLFLSLVNEITMLMAYYPTSDLRLDSKEVTTPLGKTTGRQISDINTPFLVPILRAGEGMLPAMQVILPTAKVGHVGLRRKDGEGQKIAGTQREEVVVEEYLVKLPPDAAQRSVIILDIMLASGTSAIRAIEILKQHGVEKNIQLICLITCQEGLENVNTAHPDVKIYCAAIDEKLLDNNYIYPGLGDAGDRLFGT